MKKIFGKIESVKYIKNELRSSKKDEDLEHLRGIIKEIHSSTGWKILTKLDVLKKNDLSD